MNEDASIDFDVEMYTLSKVILSEYVGLFKVRICTHQFSDLILICKWLTVKSMLMC